MEKIDLSNYVSEKGSIFTLSQAKTLDLAQKYCHY